jgi:tRNA pseudouridine65 synthase
VDGFDVIHVDDALVVVDKASGLMTHRGFGEREPALLQKVRDTVGGSVFPVHRLDRPTSGVVAFARSSAAARHLTLQFRHGLPRKRYLAWVRGKPPEFGVLDHPVPRAKDGPRVPARTAMARLLFHAGYSLVEAAPATGRYHQIRRHLKHLSAPILGDVKYGDGRNNRFARAELGLHRLALHAFRLVLLHPDTDARMVFRAPLPADFRDPLERWFPGVGAHLPSDLVPSHSGLVLDERGS